jgi:hypothetical protein
MVRHQAVRVNAPAVPARYRRKEPHEVQPVVVREEDRRLAVAPSANVVVTTGCFNAGPVHANHDCGRFDHAHRLWTTFSTFVTSAAAGHVGTRHVRLGRG